MTASDTLRRLRSTHWFRVAVASLSAAILLTAVFALAGNRYVSITLQSALVHATGMTILVSLTVPRLRACLGPRPTLVRWGVKLGAMLGLAVVGTLGACGILTGLGVRPTETYWTCFSHDLGICALITLTLGISMGLYDAQRQRLDAVTQALRERELEHERERKMALEARLSSLESRLQPHFMFNTLNAISALIQEDPDEAERTVERLAALLRFSLDATERGLVPLEHELKIVGDYVEIERTRFGDRLTWSLDVHPDVAGCEVPPLAVQTLVENGIKHAIAPRPSGGRLRVTAAPAGDRVVLSVWDDGPGFEADALRPGHGLDILRGRLAARFGAEASLEIARRDGGTLVSVSLPRATPAR
ncbi:MAG TPA: histidine kinase [Methylomirabilota bacterium]|nr:histidine kinase [Methylomirabilota bacterium]